MENLDFWIGKKEGLKLAFNIIKIKLEPLEHCQLTDKLYDALVGEVYDCDEEIEKYTTGHSNIHIGHMAGDFATEGYENTVFGILDKVDLK